METERGGTSQAVKITAVASIVLCLFAAGMSLYSKWQDPGQAKVAEVARPADQGIDEPAKVDYGERWKSPLRADGSYDLLHPENERGASRNDGAGSTLFTIPNEMIGEELLKRAKRLDEPNEVNGDPFKGGNVRTRRKDRWEISLPMQDSAQFVKKLGELEFILMIPDGPGRFKLFDMTQKNPEGKRATIIDINKMNRIWYTNRAQTACQGIAKELMLKEPPAFFAIFIPQELEVALLKAELEHANLSEKEIEAKHLVTRFQAHRKDGKWDVKVKDQKARE